MGEPSEPVTGREERKDLAYGKSMAFVKPWVQGWWEFGKSSASFADLAVEPGSPRN